MNCPFCLPVVNDSVFAESGNFLAIYNIAPILPGHVLIIPRKHVSRFLEIDDNQMTEMVVFSRKVIKVLEKAFGSKSFNWTIQEGEPAGQTIEHMHLHIIPRQSKDLAEPGDWYPRLIKNESKMIDSLTRPKHTPDEMKKIIQYLRDIY
jgi:bis(5'-adenosyl)-triphosphatase